MKWLKSKDSKKWNYTPLYEDSSDQIKFLIELFSKECEGDLEYEIISTEYVPVIRIEKLLSSYVDSINNIQNHFKIDALEFINIMKEGEF